MAERAGHRGYIGARPLNGSRTPQHVQNIVIRDYARRKNLHYLLSAAEHTMPGSYMVLEDILDELPQLRGLILYSIFMLPPDEGRRRQIYDRVLREGCDLHAAVEEITLASQKDIQAIEDILLVNRFATIL
ncbi:sporadic carbohydrate cluster protein, TIGR04323 family [Bradyrhizobium yuanmingense]|uniref:LIC12192 family sporadic carbohydrate cluster protein n=1 Tax=Bradyrhizobium TaxID=374 RepID=UPI001CD300D3|nr:MULTISPECIES: LIC12192 family sporadic carbohydrate cluster protein [unclassified Bradyrhizobium]MCA1375812.1 sporadic carbohydrate cluster protein, TIGR04323 family [Bradyrhizobium sp. IC4060]MCA1485592.1 sporadic carbohydrate cluster protein, TIGR04323 family [Bradyrhizobium sp. IC4061]MCA1512191.1 sporadic carbohydrate cluster protein, TIGR04323 family [Bradyrhizobium sp. NBAIM01]MCA1541608.1 sporadic carbohydrate cluster protein, TIGR04323 family [Bradyrhizobium sp. NBAIM32]UWU82108.1 s